MDAVEELRAIEALKRLKARYFEGVDRQDWALWRDLVWAPDASLSVPEIGATVTGVDEIVAWVKGRWTDRKSVHHGHMPDLEILSADRARGRWAMEDRLYRRAAPDAPWRLCVHGFGHYDETYVRLDRGWRIRSTVLTRLHVERFDDPS